MKYTAFLEGRTVLVTGASGGIGAAVAQRLHDRGAVVILAARSADKLAALAAKLGPRAHALAFDVADEEAVRAGFETIRERFGGVDVLVNNAGFGRFEPALDAAHDSFRAMMDVNYFAAVQCTREALPYMLRRGSGAIINVASIAGKFATAKSSGYSATKHALLGFTNALRQELHGTGVHVMAVNPGPVSTSFFDIADPEGGYVSNVRWMMVTPEQVADAVVDGLVRRKPEVNVPSWLGAAVRVGQLLPIGLVNAFSAKFLKLK